MNDYAFHPAAERNKTPILDVFRSVVAADANVLEIGSGGGQHAKHFCHEMPGLRWQPTEVGDAVGSLQLGLSGSCQNILPAIVIDVKDACWPVGKFDAIYTSNTLHIMSWEHVTAFFPGVGRHLCTGGVAVIYGPFMYHGQHTADSNRAFDLELRRKAPQMGIRDIAELEVLAQSAGLFLREDFVMPVNNRMLVFERLGEPEDE